MKIVLSAFLVFLLVGCSDDATTKEKVVVEQKAPQVEEVKKTEVVVEKTTPAVAEETKPEAKVAPKAKEETKPTVKAEAKPTAKVEEVKQEIKQEASQAVAALQKDPVALYKTCISCHGADAGKSAMNKSKIIKGWSATKIAEALRGYKDGSYGGTSKALMKGQVAKLSEEDIKILSEHIASF